MCICDGLVKKILQSKGKLSYCRKHTGNNKHQQIQRKKTLLAIEIHFKVVVAVEMK